MDALKAYEATVVPYVGDEAAVEMRISVQQRLEKEIFEQQLDKDIAPTAIAPRTDLAVAYGQPLIKILSGVLP